jgi:hypothetical protein
MRFVTGQYAKSVTQGGMIGFVMDGRTPDAISSVGAALRRRGKGLKMRRPYVLSVSLHFPKEVRVKETYDTVTQRTFRIHHVFLAAG